MSVLIDPYRNIARVNGRAVPNDPAAILWAQREAMVVPPAALRLVLHRMGLLDTVDAIAALDPEAAIVWQGMTMAQRSSPLIAALADNPIRSFTPEEIDAIFVAAAALEY